MSLLEHRVRRRRRCCLASVVCRRPRCRNGPLPQVERKVAVSRVVGERGPGFGDGPQATQTGEQP
jgi:hypothetical protein